MQACTGATRKPGRSLAPRLGHVGPASRSLYPLVAVSALGRGLVDLGVPVDVGAGAQAVMDSLAEPAPLNLEQSLT